ncbi:MAG: phosphoglucosamine mutase [bacterium]
MNKRYFGTDGIRGRVGQGNITPEFVLKLGWAAGRVLANGPGSKVVIGKDTRISGYMFESALQAGLVAAGVDIRLLGPMPTPGVAYLTRTLHADAGIVISASHNPFHDNGIKFFSGEGKKLPDDIELAIEAEIDESLVTVGSDMLGKAKRIEDAAGRYIEFCKSTVPSGLSLKGLKVVVDCAHGATYHITPRVLDELGATVVAMGDAPDGLNINDGVGSTEPAALQQRVLEEQADLGVALDGDGDRLIMVDHQGDLVDGDALLFIIANARQQAGEFRGKLVGTIMSNMGLEVALRDQGIGFERTDVGDRFILERLEQENWILGGEPSGHLICMDRTTTGDGTVSALQVLAAIVESGQTLRALASGMPRFPQILLNVKLGNQQAVAIMKNDAVQRAVQHVEHTLGSEGRVSLRPSGTEPLIRVMVEGRDDSQVRQLAQSIVDVVASLLN